MAAYIALGLGWRMIFCTSTNTHRACASLCLLSYFLPQRFRVIVLQKRGGINISKVNPIARIF